MGRIDRGDLEGPKIDRRTTLKLFGAAGLPALAASMAGCTGDEGSGGEGGQDTDQDDSQDDSSDASKQASAGGSIEVGWLTDIIEHLDPHRVNKGSQIQIQSNIQTGLVKLNENAEIVGDAAKDWNLPDGTTYEFELKEGMTFHNGDPLDAEAVKWSIERLMNFEESEHIGKVADVESVETDGELNVTINMERPVAPFIAFLTRGPGRAGTIVNRTAVEDDPEQYNYMPVGSGAFEITERNDGESLVLKAFDDYWETDDDGNQLPYLDEITIRLIPEQSTMWSALKSDSIQYTSQLTGDFANQARDMDQFTTVRSNAGEFNVIALLSSKPHEHEELARTASGNEEITSKWEGEDLPTTDKRVRQALSMAVDREEVVEKGHFGWASPAYTMFNPSIPWAHHEEPPEWGQQYDPERAKELLDEAGYTGETRLSGAVVGLAEDKRELTVIQQQFRQIGVEMELDIQQASSYWPATYNYEHMFIAYGGASDIDPWMSVYKQLGIPDQEKGTGVWQRPLWFNEEFQNLLDESYATPKIEEREKVVEELDKIICDEVPFLTTAFPANPKVMTNKLKGVGMPAGLSNFHTATYEE